MTTTDAIKRAIESGYGKQYPSHWDLTDSETIPKEKILLDKAFWQALEKGLHGERRWRRPVQVYEGLPPIPAWLWHWHSFIDALADGKTSDEYFNNLLRK